MIGGDRNSELFPEVDVRASSVYRAMSQRQVGAERWCQKNFEIPLRAWGGVVHRRQGPSREARGGRRHGCDGRDI